MFKKLFFTILIFSLSGFALNDASGLTCKMPINAITSYYASEVVFLGNAVSKESSQIELYRNNDQVISVEGEIVEFEVKEFFKGKPKTFVTVITYDNYWNTTFETGKDYIVYAYEKNSSTLGEELCTKTGPPYMFDIFQLKLLNLFNTYFIVFFALPSIGIFFIVKKILNKRKSFRDANNFQENK